MGPLSTLGLSGGGVCASRGVIVRTPPGASPASSGRAAQAVHAVVAQAQAAQFTQTRGGGGSTRVLWKEPNRNQNDGRAPVGVQWPAASRRSGSGGSWPRDASSCAQPGCADSAASACCCACSAACAAAACAAATCCAPALADARSAVASAASCSFSARSCASSASSARCSCSLASFHASLSSSGAARVPSGSGSASGTSGRAWRRSPPEGPSPWCS